MAHEDDPRLQVALSALQQGDYEAAIPTLEQILQQQPDDFLTLLYLGGAYHQTRRDPQAVNLLSRAVALQPDSAQAYYNLGISLDRVQQSSNAVAALQRALVLQPDYPMAHAALLRLQTASPPPVTGTPYAPSGYAPPVYGQPAAYSSAPAPYGPLPTYAPPLPYGQPAPYGQPTYPYQSAHSPGYVRTNPTANTALILGILSLFPCLFLGFILGPLAIVKGLQAKREIRFDPYLLGDGIATTGIVLGSLSTTIFGLWLLRSLLGG